MTPEPDVVFVTEAMTLSEWPGWLLPAALLGVMAVLLVLRRRYPGLTPILIGVAIIPVVFVALILIGQIGLVVAD